MKTTEARNAIKDALRNAEVLREEFNALSRSGVWSDAAMDAQQQLRLRIHLLEKQYLAALVAEVAESTP